jgi:polyphenol oxidase
MAAPPSSPDAQAAPPVLQADRLSALAGIRHAFFTRAGGVSDGVYATLNGGIGSADAAAHVAENRARMAAMLGVEPAQFITARQIHSPRVVIADKAWPLEARPRADAIVTRVPGLAVGVSTADCGPVLFADARAGVVGAAHAGWRGALAGIVEATVAAMETLGAARTRIVAALGPMIRQENYEVGAEVVQQFIAADTENKRFFGAAVRPEHAQFDLAGFVVHRLKRTNVGQVEDIGLCTYVGEEQFYSYRRATHRREADYGRHVNAIALTDEPD